VSKLMTLRGQATDERITVGVDVKNTGSVAGTDVAQLYIRVTGASTEQPVRLLKGFQRVTLAPGESKHVDFKLGYEELSYITMRGVFGLEAAHYDIYVGDSSLATAHTQFLVEADPKPVHAEGGPPASNAGNAPGAKVPAPVTPPAKPATPAQK
jgi:hypothetical protein